MDIFDWFDPDNIEHLKAYKYLQDIGWWPEGFLPAGLTMPRMWQTCLAYKLAERYVEEKLGEQICHT